jgi:hypothetical protein
MISPDMKRDAHLFLKDFHKVLGDQLPAAGSMEPLIRQTTKAAKSEYTRRHLRLPEAAFLNAHVIPLLAEAARVHANLTMAQTRDALLNEYHPSMNSISRDLPARTVKHPFSKALGAAPGAIYARWADPQNSKSIVQSCPDFALRAPFPHKIVFEGKYFSNGSLAYAQGQLVTDIYQAFFYRGLPFVDQTPRGRAGWDYDYSCLLAYDASPQGTLQTAWTDLPDKVKRSFWEGANIYVMILGRQGRAA